MEERQMKRLFSIILMTLLGFMTKAWADNISIENGKIAPKYIPRVNKDDEGNF